MAQRVITQLISDLSGKDIEDGDGLTIEFGLDGVNYEIDVTNKEADQLRSVMERYISVARRVSGRARRGTAATAPKSNAKLVKEWADKQGLDYPQRGRLPQSLVDQYEAAQK